MSSILRPARRGLAALLLSAVTIVGGAVVGAAPVGAIVPPQCLGSEAREFTCGAYSSFADRVPSQAEVDYWAPRLPVQKTTFLTTLGRSLESRRLIVDQAYGAYADRASTDVEVSYWVGEILKPNGFRRLQAALYNEGELDGADFVTWAYYGLVGRVPTADEITYWGDRAAATSKGQTAVALGNTPEARRQVAWTTYVIELQSEPDGGSVIYWSERLRTGLSYLDLRIMLISAGYPQSSAGCSSHTPPVRPECVPD